jgi:hypothetical protein
MTTYCASGDVRPADLNQCEGQHYQGRRLKGGNAVALNTRLAGGYKSAPGVAIRLSGRCSSLPALESVLGRACCEARSEKGDKSNSFQDPGRLNPKFRLVCIDRTSKCQAYVSLVVLV